MRNLFVGIDLGIERKKTSSIFILKENKGKVLPFEWEANFEDIFGREVLKRLRPYFDRINVIAIDAPLTKGRGKGKMRLFEKFFSRKIFREEKINPVPPSFMPELCQFSLKIRKKLEKEGFVLDINLIETSSRLINAFLFRYNFIKEIEKKCKTQNQKSAFLSSLVAYFHSKFQTRYIGYKDGFLFLPQISFWKKEWRRKFYLAWKERPRLRYRYLITNIFEK
jgi:predicted nuclease with RNAse H fold